MKIIWKNCLCSLFFTIFIFTIIPIQWVHASDVKTVRVGYFTFPGYHDIDSNGKKSGYGYEYLQEMAKYTGWKYEYISGTWEECLTMLQNGEIDLLTSAQPEENRDNMFLYSDYSVGNSSTMLTVVQGNEKYGFNEFESFQNMIVGYMEGDGKKGNLDKLCEDKGISIQCRSYPSEVELSEALQSGAVDAVLTSSFRKISNEQVIAKFTPSPFYCIVNQNNMELLNEVNMAQEQIEIQNSQYSSELYNKHYGENNNKTLIFSEQEQEYLKNRTIRAVASPGRKPMSYFDQGVYKGIVADVIKEIEKKLGVKIHYIETKSYEESIQKVKNGEADIICNYYADYDWAEQNHFKITSSFLKLQYSAISRKNQIENPKSVAAVKGFYFNNAFLESRYEKNQITYYRSEEECIQAILDGKHDITYLNTFSAEQLMRENRMSSLDMTLVNNFSHNVAIGMNESQDWLLYRIIDKTVQSITEEEISNIGMEYTMDYDTSLTWKEWIYQNPISFIVIISCIALAIIIFLVIILLMRKRFHKHIYRLAYEDEVTGLWNKYRFEYELGKKLSSGHKQHLAILSFDIHHFGLIKQNYGREVGKDVLRYVAKNLIKQDSKDNLVAKGNEDIFYMLILYTDEKVLLEKMEWILDGMGIFSFDETKIRIMFHVGCYKIENKEIEPTTAIEFAEIARKASKVCNPCKAFFDQEMEKKIRWEQEIEEHMEQAMENGEFVIYFQPKYDMRDVTMIGAEALIRWQDKEKGLIPPDLFIPYFEKNGFILQLDFYVLETVCQYIQKRIENKEKIVPISVNQSRAHLGEENYIEELRRMIAKYDIPRGLIELELTESTFVNSLDMIDALKAVQDIGFMISMDDFGSGYSSLNLLNRVPLDILKIDKDMLMESRDSARTRTIIKKIIEMARELEMSVICEGVEEEHQVQFLMNIGCNYAQGYYYAKPMPQDKFEERLDRHSK